MKKITYLLYPLLFLGPAIANAVVNERAVVLNSAGAPINTQTASLIDKNTWGLSIRNDYFAYRQFGNQQLLDYAKQTGRVIESDQYFNLTTAALAYGINEQFTFWVSLPYANLGNVRNGELVDHADFTEPRVIHLGNSRGVGDLGLYGQWLFYDNQSSQSAAMLSFGSTLPTGATAIKDKQGRLFTPLDQLGRGTFAPFIGVALSKNTNNGFLSSNVLYTKGLKGAQRSNLGDVINYNLAITRDLYQTKSQLTINGIVELNGEYYSKTLIDGVSDNDSGANIIYLTTALRINTKQGLSPYLAFSPPIVQSVNGIQSTVRCLITAGVDLVF